MATRTSQSHASTSALSLSSSASSSASQPGPSSATGPSRVASAPGLSRQMSAMSIGSVTTPGSEVPVATASVVNKAANSSAGLYQNCLSARAMMRRVPGFEDGPWVDLPPSTEAGPSAPHGTSNLHDPVSQVLAILRLGSSLCYLFNALLSQPVSPPSHPSSLPPLPPGKSWESLKPITVDASHPRDNLQACKRSTAWFVMAVRTELGWGTPEDLARGGEEMFMVNMLYDSNTNATVKVISNVLRLLNLLAARGALLPPAPEDDGAINNATGETLDDRGKVVREILDSERKYVQDLEVLQNYQRSLIQGEVLPPDQIRNLFMNLDGLLDFQRRFLIGIEANARLGPDEQRFGHLFLSMERNFVGYETFCANFASASQLAQDELPALSAKSDLLNPGYELPAFLIKPIQRICKYPMLLDKLIKQTPKTSPFYRELKDGHAAITRVVDAVNETTRERENELAVDELRGRVEDWKGHDVKHFGPLVLEDTFPVIKNDSEREYHVYLFEKIILCCKEVGPGAGGSASGSGAAGGGGAGGSGGGRSEKKNSKSNSMLRRPAAARKKTTLQLKGRIFITNVLGATQPPRSTSSWPWLLQVTWRGDQADEFFAIKCRSEDQLRKWQSSIARAVEEAAMEKKKRQQAHLSASVRRGITSPQSQFPTTPLSELGPSASAPSMMGHHHPYAYGGVSNRGFEEGADEDGFETGSGRSTPMGRRPGVAHRSMPTERSGDPASAAHANRPRALTTTEDPQPSTSSSSSSRWRRELEGGGGGQSALPPIPTGSGPTSPAGPPSLRSSGSSRNLRHKQSHEWGSAGFARAESDLGRSSVGTEGGGVGGSMMMTRQGSQVSLPPHHHQPHQPPTPGTPGYGPPGQYAGLPPHAFRNRSASSPNIYQVEGAMMAQQAPPHLPQNASMSSSSSRGAQYGPALGVNGLKRGSDGSSATDRSSDDSSGRTPATSPASTTVPNSVNGSVGRSSDPSSASIRFKLRSGEDQYVIVALATISFSELQDKVVKKLRNCGVVKRDAGAGDVRIRYEDEEGDKILMSADDDVHMAIDFLRQSRAAEITLFVD